MTTAKPNFYFECPFCNRDAFGFLVKPQKGDRITIENIIHADEPTSGQVIKCQRCGRNIPPWHLNVERIYPMSELATCVVCDGDRVIDGEPCPECCSESDMTGATETGDR